MGPDMLRRWGVISSFVWCLLTQHRSGVYGANLNKRHSKCHRYSQLISLWGFLSAAIKCVAHLQLPRCDILAGSSSISWLCLFFFHLFWHKNYSKSMQLSKPLSFKQPLWASSLEGPQWIQVKRNHTSPLSQRLILFLPRIVLGTWMDYSLKMEMHFR